VANERRARVVVSAVTLTETLRGGAHDAAYHRVLDRVVVSPVSHELGRGAGELLGEHGLSGHSHAVDAIVAVTALHSPAPVMLLTSDSSDLRLLVDAPHRPKGDRVTVVQI
jgi:predicted nucleic acid-binding protein